jgi:hypothetical protein
MEQLECIKLGIGKDRKKRTLERLRCRREDDIKKLEILRKCITIVNFSAQDKMTW